LSRSRDTILKLWYTLYISVTVITTNVTRGLAITQAVVALTMQHTMSVEILSTGAKRYQKSHFKGQRHYSIGHTLPIVVTTSLSCTISDSEMLPLIPCM